MYPRTLLDGLKRSVTVPVRPAWIAAVSRGAEEILAELAPGERIVPASRLREAVDAGAPGVVLADHDVASAAVAALDGSGVPVVGLTGAAGSAYAVQTNVGLGGRAIGAERPAAGLNARIDVVVERYRATAAAAGGPLRRVTAGSRSVVYCY